MNKFVYVAMVVFGLVACEKSVSDQADATVVDSGAKVEAADVAVDSQSADAGEVLMTPADSGAGAVPVSDAAKDAAKKD